MSNVLIIDDEISMRKVLKAALKKDYTVFEASSGEEGLEVVRKEHIDMIITDLQMDGISGMEVLEKVKAIDSSIMVLLMTAFATVENAVDAMKKGAYDYVLKPFKIDEVRLIIGRALEQKKTSAENVYLRQELKNKYRFENIVGKSERMHTVFEMIDKVAKIDSTVLLFGESGTGKELVAKAIHYNSYRKDKPFVAVDCGALAENILESELFGHVKGSFTGAVKDKDGLFKFANGGTIFLDEIGSVSSMMQAKLLRVIQEREVKRVGDVKSIKVDTRVVAATNIDLEKEVEEKRFREDLFYRLNVILIPLPPLRDRKEDIPLLSRYFLEKLKTDKKISAEVEALFINYDWPGNVRELENIIERGVALSESEIRVRDIPEKIQGAQESIVLKDVINNLEEKHITKVLRLFNHDKKVVAEKLGLDLVTLYRKLKKLKIG